MYSNRRQEGMRHVELAYELDPLSIGIAANRAWGLYFTRHYAAAAKAFAGVLALDSALFAMHNGLGRTLQQMGRRDEALAAYRRAVELGGTTQGKAFLAQALARFGFPGEARALRDEIERTGDNALALAIVDVGLGDFDAAFAGLERALAQSAALNQLPLDPVYDPLRSDPRYAQLQRRISPLSTP
jgi:tetratricopeptide (TPR) repeat protein